MELRPFRRAAHISRIDEWLHRYEEFPALCERKRFLGSAR